ncbi:hypothetical protein K469DRAFT_708100 [Zopfia rhizophila CBS 207.26]|uniref:Uncharacterized protein n=1 Tax=Zopfia rhizophila CBS 207.26 TaxID=1314779 RepID=A0A6A6E2T9_9PEZI|nr:hypothetical protein K469DRAFT_708100 [Zopfia rhizophila CBS 207.26]
MLQGREQPTQKQKQEEKPCISEEIHPWGKCPILIKDLRGPDFVLDPDKERLVNEKLEANPTLQGIVNSVQERERRRRKASTPLRHRPRFKSATSVLKQKFHKQKQFTAIISSTMLNQ